MIEGIPPAQWRDAQAYAAITEGGRSALAWELLRRDPDYQTYATAGAGHGIVDAAPEVAAARWGLHFPVRSSARM